MEEIKNIVVEIRDVKTSFRIPVNQNVDVDYYGISLLLNDEHRNIVEFLAKVKFNGKEKDSIQNIPEGEIVKIWGNGWFSMKTEGVIDFEAEKKKLIGERDKIMKIFEGVEKKLSSDKFLTRAPEDVIEKTKKLRDELKSEIEKIKKNLKLLTREQ
jgi:valyl-tRNA synthetase